MNTFAKAATVLALAFIGAGCSEFLSGPGLTENPNDPTQATAVQQLIAVQANMSARLEGQIARCASIFTQQLIGSNNQQLSYCTAYGVTEADISGQMSGFYTGAGLKGMRNVQALARASADSFMVGMAVTWEGFAMGTATAVWGDLPYSEALTPGIETPALDPQEDIYAAVQTRLDEAITAFTAARNALLAVPADTNQNCVPNGLGTQADLIYCATAIRRLVEYGRWIRAAHTLKARFHLHLVERNGVSEYAAALAEATLGINEAPTSSVQAIHGQAAGDFRTFHGSVQDVDANIWGEFLLSRQDIVAGNAMIQIMKARGDTVRMAGYLDANAQGQYVGNDQNNLTVTPVGCAAPCAASVVDAATRRVFTFRQPLVTWAENQLILAEAKYKTGDSAGAAVNVNAVRTAVGLVALPAPTFVDIMTEKYLAQYQNIDTWADYKRTCIPTVIPNGGAAEVLGRLPYGSAERSANNHVPLPSAYPTGTTGASAVRNWNDPNACP